MLSTKLPKQQMKLRQISKINIMKHLKNHNHKKKPNIKYKKEKDQKNPIKVMKIRIKMKQRIAKTHNPKQTI